jgi:hypothetical protein
MIGNETVWYYDIYERLCKKIQKECLPESNPNHFESFENCKNQCLPNIDDDQSQS